MSTARLFGVTLALACFTGCSTGIVRPIPQNAAISSASRSNAKDQNLYVADLAAVTVYAPGSDAPVRTITDVAPSAIALDASKNLYVANIPAGGRGSVTVYRTGTSKRLRTLKTGIDDPRVLAFDAANNLYVANSYFSVAVFEPGETSPKRYIKVFYPSAMVFDRSSNLYVASDPSPYGGRGGTKILVYAPGGKLLRKIVEGLNNPQSLALSSVGNLFVANYSGNTVTVYASGKSSVIRTISQGIRSPYALVFDESGDLFVANSLASTVTVYPPGSSKVMRTIHQGIAHPTALRFDASGNLYVANSKDVTVYPPDADVPMRTIVKGINSPIALRFGP